MPLRLTRFPATTPHPAPPSHPQVVTRRQLAAHVAYAAHVLRHEYKLGPRSRVLVHLPTSIEQMVWLLACMRVGVIYTATAIDHPLSALKYRMEDFAPDAVITTDAAALNAGQDVSCGAKVDQLVAEGLVAAADVLRLDADGVNVRGKGTGAGARAQSVDDAKKLSAALALLKAGGGMADAELAAKVWGVAPAEAVSADFPLFVSYTSGSTGKPKGIVHCHGGYVRSDLLLGIALQGSFRPGFYMRLTVCCWFSVAGTCTGSR